MEEIQSQTQQDVREHEMPGVHPVLERMILEEPHRENGLLEHSP